MPTKRMATPKTISKRRPMKSQRELTIRAKKPGLEAGAGSVGWSSIWVEVLSFWMAFNWDWSWLQKYFKESNWFCRWVICSL